LSHALDGFLYMAEIKLDRSQTGNIHNREEIDEIVVKCRELNALLPNRAALDLVPITDDSFDMLEQTGGDTKRIIALKSLTAEEWEEMRKRSQEDRLTMHRSSPQL